MIRPIFILQGVTMTPTATRFIPFDSSNLTTTVGGTQTYIAVPGQLGNIYFQLTAAPGVGATYTFTLFKNGTTTGYSFTISGATQTSFSDTTTLTTFAAGDQVCWQVVPSATAPAASTISASCTFTSTNAGETTMGASTSLNYADGTTRYVAPFAGSSAFSTTDALASMVFPCAGVLDLWRWRTTAPGTSNTETWTVYQNGSPSALTGSITGAGTTATDLTHSISVAAGDSISIQVVPTSAFTVSAYDGSMRWTPTTDGQTPLMMSATANQAAATRFPAWMGVSNNLGTEAAAQIAAPIGIYLSNLTLTMSVAPGSGKSWTLIDRDGGASQTLTATVANTNTSATDTTHTDTFVQGDLVNWMITLAGAPAATMTKISAIGFVPSGIQMIASDSSAVSDTPNLYVPISVIALESTAVTDLPFYYDDTALVRDTVNIQIQSTGSGVNVSDSTAVSDTPKLEIISFVNTTDSSAVSDTPNLEIFSSIKTIDSSVVSDSPTIEIISLISAIDSTAVSDLPSFEVFSYVNDTDTSVVSDIPVLELISYIGQTDFTGVSDSPAFELFSYVIASDTSVVTDTVKLEAVNQGINITESTVVSDTPTLEMFSYVNISESIITSDLPILLIISPGAINVLDSTAVSDTSVLELISYINVSDSSALSDIPTIQEVSGSKTITVSDSTAISDSPNLEIFSYVNITESTVVSDTPSLEIFSYIFILEATSVSDAPLIEVFSFINTLDSSAVTDVAQLERLSLISVADSSAVSDTPKLELISYIAISESILVSDTALLKETSYVFQVIDTSPISDFPILNLRSYAVVNDTSIVSDTPIVSIVAAFTPVVLGSFAIQLGELGGKVQLNQQNFMIQTTDKIGGYTVSL